MRSFTFKLLPLGIVAILPCVSAQNHGPKSHFFTGDLGTVTISDQNLLQPLDMREAALGTLQTFLVQGLGATGNEEVQPADEEVHVDDKGDMHIRYLHYLDGMVVEGAAMMMHINGRSGQVFAINGEYGPTKDTRSFAPQLSCDEAIRQALSDLRIENRRTLSECTLSA